MPQSIRATALLVSAMALTSTSVGATPFEIIAPRSVTVNTSCFCGGWGVNAWLVMGETPLEPPRGSGIALLTLYPATTISLDFEGWATLFAEPGPYPGLAPHEVTVGYLDYPAYSSLLQEGDILAPYESNHIVLLNTFEWPYLYVGAADFLYTVHLGNDVVRYTTTVNFVDDPSLRLPLVTDAQRLASVFDPTFQPSEAELSDERARVDVPEPSVALLLGIGLAGLLIPVRRWRREGARSVGTDHEVGLDRAPVVEAQRGTRSVVIESVEPDEQSVHEGTGRGERRARSRR